MPKAAAVEVEAGDRVVRVSSPDRVIYEATDRTPEVTKLMVAEFFASVDDGLMRALRDRYASLTHREREVMALVTSGLLNKQVGGELGISEITVKAHRGQAMQKMKADSLADLVKMAARLGLASAPKD